MKEIKIRNNKTKKKIFIDSFPDLKQIPKDDLDLFFTALELQISAYYKKTKKKTINKDKG